MIAAAFLVAVLFLARRAGDGMRSAFACVVFLVIVSVIIQLGAK